MADQKNKRSTFSMTKKRFVTYLLAGSTLVNLGVNAFSEVVFGGIISNQIFTPKVDNGLQMDFEENGFYLVKKNQDENDSHIKLIKLTSKELSSISTVIDTTRAVKFNLK